MVAMIIALHLIVIDRAYLIPSRLILIEPISIWGFPGYVKGIKSHIKIIKKFAKKSLEIKGLNLT